MEDQTARVLVAYGTKMGGTRGIAETIRDVLVAHGFAVTLSDAGDLSDLAGYDAAVLGSAIYAARWHSDAVGLLSRHASGTARIPIWLFQSGPCGPDINTASTPTPKKVQRLALRVGAATPTTFGGRLTPDTAKGFLARRMASGPLAGDFRDFAEIRRWGETIAAQMALPDHRPVPQ